MSSRFWLVLYYDTINTTITTTTIATTTIIIIIIIIFSVFCIFVQVQSNDLQAVVIDDVSFGNLHSRLLQVSCVPFLNSG